MSAAPGAANATSARHAPDRRSTRPPSSPTIAHVSWVCIPVGPGGRRGRGGAVRGPDAPSARTRPYGHVSSRCRGPRMSTTSFRRTDSEPGCRRWAAARRSRPDGAMHPPCGVGGGDTSCQAARLMPGAAHRGRRAHPSMLSGCPFPSPRRVRWRSPPPPHASAAKRAADTAPPPYTARCSGTGVATLRGASRPQAPRIPVRPLLPGVPVAQNAESRHKLSPQEPWVSWPSA